MTSSSPGQQTGRTIMLGTSRAAVGTPTSGGQKFVILQSRSQAATVANINSNTIQQQPSQQQQQQQQSQQQQSQQQQVKITQSNVVQQKTHMQSNASKLVVVCMPSSTHGTTTVSQVCII